MQLTALSADKGEICRTERFPVVVGVTIAGNLTRDGLSALSAASSRMAFPRQEQNRKLGHYRDNTVNFPFQ